PPVPGLRELEGIWTNREVTGMKAVPRRLLILGGGPVGVEMAQAVRRFGGEVALVEGGEHVRPREPAPLGEALGGVLRRGGVALADVPKTATYTRAYAESNGFMTLLSDGERLVGAYALGPEAGEWLQQATLAIRARVPLDVLRDTIQPFPTFSEIYVAALNTLHDRITAAPRPAEAGSR